MPLVRDFQTIGPTGRLPELAPDVPEPDFFGETLPAAFRTENTVGSLVARIEDRPDKLLKRRDPDFDPFVDIDGYEEHADAFALAADADDVARVKRRIGRERQDRETLARAGWSGLAASVAAGLIDPVNLIPVGGAAYKTYRVGGSILRGGLVTARAGLLGSTAAEALLHATQETRTGTESALNIGTATLLSGVLGGAAGKARELLEKRAIGRLHDEARVVGEGGRVGGSGKTVEVRLAELEEGLERALFDMGEGRLNSDGSVKLKTNFGMVKVVWKHGVESPKAEGGPAHLMVTRDDVTVFPEIARRYTAEITRIPERNHYRWSWVATRRGVDGQERKVLYSVQRFTHADGAEHVVTIHVPRKQDSLVPSSPRGLRERYFGQKRKPGSSRTDVGASEIPPGERPIPAPGGRAFRARPETESSPPALFGDEIPPGERLIPTSGGRARDARKENIPPGGAKVDAMDDLSARTEDDLTVPHPEDADPLEPGYVRLDEDDLTADTAARVGEEAAEEGDGRKGSVGAKAARDTTLAEEALKSAFGLEKAIRFQSPLLRAATSRSVETRRTVQDLAETPFFYEKNALGVASPISAEARVRAWNGPLADTLVAVKGAYAKHRRAGGKLSRAEFNEAIGKAAVRGDKSEIPEIQAIMPRVREHLDALKDEAIRQKLLPEDVQVETAASYLTRVYDVPKMIARQPEFVGRVTDWLRGLRDTATERIDEIEESIAATEKDVARLDSEYTLSRQEEKLTRKDLAKAKERQNRVVYDARNAERGLRDAEAQARKAEERAERFEPTEALTKDDPLREALADLRRGGPKEKPLRLNDWARRRGGLVETGGELAAIGIKPGSKGVAPGLVGKSGMKLDDAVLAAWEDGYFPGFTERPDVDDFLTALRDDFMDLAPAVREADFEIVAYREYLDELGRALDELGLDPRKAKDEEIADALDAAAAGRDPDFRASTPASRARFREIELWRRQAERRKAVAAEKVAKAEGRVAKAKAELEEASTSARALKETNFKLERTLEGARTRLRKLRDKRDGDRYLADAEDQELQSIAEEIFHKITGTPGGRIFYESFDIQALKRGPLRERTFNIPDVMIEDFLERDIDLVLRHYTRTMAADVELTRAFGRADMTDQLAKIRDDYTRKINRAESDGERTRLNKAMRADIRDIEAMRDRIRGTFAASGDPNSALVRAGRLMRDWNFMRLGGMIMLSSVPDVGRAVMVHGLRRTIGDGLAPLARNLRSFRLAAREARLAGTALDMVLNSRAASAYDIGDDFGRLSKVERLSRYATDRFSVYALVAPWNTVLKQFSGVVSATRILEESAAWRAGAVKPKHREYLAMLGIDEDLAGRIAGQFDEFGEAADGARIAHTDKWTDRDALVAFRAALAKDVDRIIVTPGQEKPIWMSTEWGKVIGQFKAFSMASSHRVLLAGLQQRDVAALNGTLLMVGLGSLRYAAGQWLNGREVDADLDVLIAEGIDRSGVTGWFFDVNNIVEKASEGTIGLSAALGRPPMSRYAYRNFLGSLLGPSAGLVSDTKDATGRMLREEGFTPADARAVRRLLPYQNHFMARKLFDAAEAGIAEAIGAAN